MKKWIISALALGAVLLTATGVLLVSAWQNSGEPSVPGQFLLTDCGGRVAVCEVGRESRRITPIRVERLPSADRRSLQSGIYARDLTELAMLLEDLGC